MMVTPVTASPCRMVWKMGAGPLQRGSRLGWTFKIPLKGHKHTRDQQHGMVPPHSRQSVPPPLEQGGSSGP